MSPAHARISTNGDVIQRVGRRRRHSRASELQWEIEGFQLLAPDRPRRQGIFSCGEAGGGGRGG
jgi:hypothetical protein